MSHSGQRQKNVFRIRKKSNSSKRQLIGLGRIFLVFSIGYAERLARLNSFFSNRLQVPEEWRTFFYNWEPQIWYFLQQFAWVRRSEEYAKQVAIQFALTSQMTADLKVKTPDATAERNDLSLPMKIERFPSSLQEIKNSIYGKTFSQLHNSFSKSSVTVITFET